jgi:hypothetical protein
MLTHGLALRALDVVLAADADNLGCSGAPNGSEANLRRADHADEFLRFLKSEEVSGWEMAPSAELLGAFEAYFDAVNAFKYVRVYETPLLDEACGGSGSGRVFLIHNRASQTVALYVLVEWSE